MKKQDGFTLIELVLVIALLGALAVSALPNIFSISLTSAQNNARDAVSSAVQTALSLYAASQISQGAAESYPADLDGEDDGIAADREHPLFDIILKGGVIKSWTKQDDNCYQYTGGAGTDEYQYDSTAPDPVGTFVYVSAGC